MHWKESNWYFKPRSKSSSIPVQASRTSALKHSARCLERAHLHPIVSMDSKNSILWGWVNYLVVVTITSDSSIYAFSSWHMKTLPWDYSNESKIWRTMNHNLSHTLAGNLSLKSFGPTTTICSSANCLSSSSIWLHHDKAPIKSSSLSSTILSSILPSHYSSNECFWVRMSLQQRF
jgi:hypothetical protein